MRRCEHKKTADGKKTHWVERDAAGLNSGTSPFIRCKWCHGAVRVHIKRTPTGPADHVEHCQHEDTENCQGGVHFKGVHKMSQFPVE